MKTKTERCTISLMFYLVTQERPAGWREMLRMLWAPSNRSATVWDRLIAFHCRSNISHVELRFADGQWFSSSPRDGGCRFKEIRFKAGRWTEIRIEVTPGQEQAMFLAAKGVVGCKYDWPGMLGFLWNPADGSRTRRYCSEAVNDALKDAGILPVKLRHISPSALQELVLRGTGYRLT